MSQYSQTILSALIIFPFVALFFTLPYILYNYRKFGSVFSLRIAIIYSFILYLICAYFLVILPLPSIDYVAQLTSSKTQLVPFSFLQDISQSTNLIISEPSTYLPFLSSPAVYQLLFNIILSIPFGMYLRYYFKCSLKKTILFSFLLSLFFELTQLSGLYFIYPRGYRLFDVDDLIVNTVGGLIGYAIMTPFMKILPTRIELDEESYKRGIRVSLLRRVLSLGIDFLCIYIIYALLSFYFYLFDINATYLFVILILIYFTFVPIITKGYTLGKALTKTRVVDMQDKQPKWYQYLIRYGSLYTLFSIVPYICINILNDGYELSKLSINSYGILMGSIIAFIIFCLFFFCIEIATHKKIYYERLSKTHIISTIQVIQDDDEDLLTQAESSTTNEKI